MKYDYLVVGAGFAGAVIAEQLHGRGKTVLVVDRRSHIGGNSFDELDGQGVRIHRYGPHLFHTNAPHVSEYLSRFTDWHPYQHRVLAHIDGELMPIPINRTTLEMFFDRELPTDEDAEKLLEEIRVPIAEPANSEELVLSRVGPDLYEAFFKNYTTKQWGRHPSELARHVCGRIPTRTNRDDRYFTDDFQAIPKDGYTAMFGRMLGGIDVLLNTQGAEVLDAAHNVVWTGPLDEAFGCRLGRLPWRSLEFTHVTKQSLLLRQEAMVVNYPSLDVPWTRITEYRHATGQAHDWTSFHVEHPRADGEPFYPVPAAHAQQLQRDYQKLAGASSWTFVGRLARYQYLEIGQVVAQALKIAGTLA